MLKEGIFAATPVLIVSSDGNLENDEMVISGGFAKVSSFKAKTQKARGIFFLQDKEAKVKSIYGWRVPKHLLFDAGEEFGEGSFNFPIFVRPCPTVPKHGFVDSIICNNAEELNALSNETFKVEEDAEILVTKPVDSAFNAIINGGVITFAKGNDGATSGKGVQYFYINDDPLSKAINLDPNILLEGEVPFYEMVFSKEGESRLVQVRSAPGTPRAKDFIPHKVEIKKIIKAEGDLLEWEEKMVGIDPLTTVIDHLGGSLSSHYAIHSIINKIPIFTTYSPKVGDVIEPTVESPDINDDDRESFKEAFIAGFNSAPYVYKNMNFKKSQDARPILLGILELSLATLHNFSGLSLSRDYDLLGVVLGLFVRTTFAVSAGEARHSSKKSEFIKSYKFGKKMEKFFKKCSYDREICYNTMFSKKTKKCIEDIEIIYYIFKDLPWTSSYGGRKWASCTESSIKLFNAGARGDIESVVSLFNRVINEEHNGGKYLNKLILISQFDEAANNPSQYALKNLPKIIDTLDTARRYRVEKEEEWRGTFEFFSEIEIEPLPELPKVKEKTPTEKKSLYPQVGKTKKIKDVSVYASKYKGQLDKIQVTFYKSTKSVIIDIDPIKNKEAKLNISYDVQLDLHKLDNIPFWWALEGNKIISKKILKSKIDKAIEVQLLPASWPDVVADKNKAIKQGVKKVSVQPGWKVESIEFKELGVIVGSGAAAIATIVKLPKPISYSDWKWKIYSLKSIPNWWVDPGGNKVISKMKLNYLVKNKLLPKIKTLSYGQSILGSGWATTQSTKPKPKLKSKYKWTSVEYDSYGMEKIKVDLLDNTKKIKDIKKKSNSLSKLFEEINILEEKLSASGYLESSAKIAEVADKYHITEEPKEDEGFLSNLLLKFDKDPKENE